MTSRLERAPGAEPARNRCRCGHYPTSHMRVAMTSGGGGFQLEPTAPCAICREASCPRFTPAV